MGLYVDFIHARAFLCRTAPAEAARLKTLCHQIRVAEQQLNRRALPLLTRCRDTCQGLCCRNIMLEEIITPCDLVYLLAESEGLQDRIGEELRRIPTLYSAPCVFLDGGRGPCIFPAAVRPEKCLATFCADEGPVREELRNLRRAFGRLNRFLLGQRMRMLIGLFSRCCGFSGH